MINALMLRGIGNAGTGAWTPESLANLSLWLDAADASTITLNGSTVSQWRDKSGNARHIAQATAVNQPTYNATGLNSRPTLSFDGADWLFNATPGALLRNVGGGSMTAVASYPSVPAAAGVAVAVQTAVLSSRLNINIQPTGLLSTGARRLDTDTAVTSTASTAQALNTPVIHGNIANFTGNSLQLFVDGVGATATTFSSGGGNSSDTDAGTLLVGGASSDDGVTIVNPFTGLVSEVILTNSALSVSERQQIEGYLAWKWGLVTNLPYDHPYRWDGRLFGGTLLWRPDQLGSALALWLDAEDTASITLNGATVSQWDDKSGNNFHLSQATAANQPTYSATGLNAKPTLVTDGTDFLTRSNVPIIKNVGQVSVAIVLEYAAATTFTNNPSELYVSINTPATSTRFLSTASSTLGLANRQSIAGRRLDTDLFNSANSSRDSLALRGSPFFKVAQADYQNAQANHWTNGLQDLTAAAYQSAGTTSDTDAAVVQVFNGVSLMPTGTKISEIVVIENTLSTVNRQRIEGYLAWKWGGV